MQHYTILPDVSLSESWLSIGSFDGVHRGHQQILRNMVSAAHAARAHAVVLTFYPHPAAVLRGQNGPFYLTTPEEKKDLISALKVDILISLPFTRELAMIHAADFMADLKHRLGLNQLWVGYNFTLGKDREGDIPTLRRLGDLLGYTLEIIPPIQIEGEMVSSSLIRGLLGNGDVTKAAALLGRPYSVSGEIIHGDGRGRGLGIPTANLDIMPEKLMPTSGVYATWTWVGGERLLSVTNVGVRPTFDHQPALPRVETLILDFDRDLYGQNLRVEFVQHLRGEEKFSSVDALLSQIQKDIEKTRRALSQ